MRRRKFPAPPPTPEGFVWRTDQRGRTLLVPIDEAQKHSQKIMRGHDTMPKFLRKRAWGDDYHATQDP